MTNVVSIYAPSKEIREDAKILVKILNKKSLSSLVWEIIQGLIKNHRQEIEDEKTRISVAKQSYDVSEESAGVLLEVSRK